MAPDGNDDRGADLTAASTGELVGRLAGEGQELIKKEMELAKAELRTEWKDEVKMALGIAVGAVVAFVTLELLFAALVLALAQSMSGWAAALVVAGVAFVLGAVIGVVGWKMRARSLLARTSKTLKEDARWVQRQLT